MSVFCGKKNGEGVAYTRENTVVLFIVRRWSVPISFLPAVPSDQSDRSLSLGGFLELAVFMYVWSGRCLLHVFTYTHAFTHTCTQVRGRNDGTGDADHPTAGLSADVPAAEPAALLQNHGRLRVAGTGWCCSASWTVHGGVAVCMACSSS